MNELKPHAPGRPNSCVRPTSRRLPGRAPTRAACCGPSTTEAAGCEDDFLFSEGTLRLNMEVHGTRFGLKPEDLFELGCPCNSKAHFLFGSAAYWASTCPIRPSALLEAKAPRLAYLGEEDTCGWADLFRAPSAPPADVVGRCWSAPATPSREADRTLFVGSAERPRALPGPWPTAFLTGKRLHSTTRLEVPGRPFLTFDGVHSPRPHPYALPESGRSLSWRAAARPCWWTTS